MSDVRIDHCRGSVSVLSTEDIQRTLESSYLLCSVYLPFTTSSHDILRDRGPLVQLEPRETEPGGDPLSSKRYNLHAGDQRVPEYLFYIGWADHIAQFHRGDERAG